MLGGLLAADVGARLWAEGQVEAAARREAPEASASADIDGFPFLPPLLLSGHVSHVDLTLRDVGVERFRFDRVAFSLDGVDVSRRALLRERRIELIDVDRGTITAELSLGLVREVLGRRLPEGEVTATVTGRVLRLALGQVSVTVPLPHANLLPCDGRARVTGQRVVISCTVTEVPPGLVRAVAGAA